jgi:nitroimidazol reductase NimA-like FMN-containing flavoprotein (pyridoxamine 5'-phosphate oxidase superfamily)
MSSEMRDLSREECLELLAANGVGRLAVSAKDAPVIRPVNYVFDEPSQSVVFRTAPGSKFYALLRQRTAAFEVDGIDRDDQSGWSVIIVGATEEVTNPSDVRRLDGLGLEQWAPGEKPHWVRIRAWTVSGRWIAAEATPR